MVSKLGSDRLYENSAVLSSKLKELVSVCNKKFGLEWGGKNGGSEKGGEFVEWLFCLCVKEWFYGW